MRVVRREHTRSLLLNDHAALLVADSESDAEGSGRPRGDADDDSGEDEESGQPTRPRFDQLVEEMKKAIEELGGGARVSGCGAGARARALSATRL